MLSAAETEMTDVFIGRQPIYNSNLGVYAYELLFRSPHRSIAQTGADAATAQVVVDTFLEIGVDRLAGTSLAAINATEQFMRLAPSLPIPPERIILDIPAASRISLPFMDSVKKLAAMGYRIAIDDCIETPQFRPLVPLADIIKVDVKRIDNSDLKRHVKVLKKLKIPLLALKVETLSEYEYYRDTGFEYSQGYFLSRPRIIKSAKLSDNRLAIMKLLCALYDWETDNTEIATMLSEDVSLSYKLLKLINSPFFGLSHEVRSIKQAVVLLGRKALQAWVSMLALAGINSRSPELTRIALTRAKMCEVLAQKAAQPSPDSYFTVGMFSALDILMDRPLTALIRPLPLNEAVKTAALDRAGDMGAALDCALANESSSWERVSFKGLSVNELSQSYLEALEWANQVMTALAGHGLSHGGGQP
jgi:EAL and modified HD-GYP domain-containing signal transduction protein